MKKYFSILLLNIILFHLGGYYIWYSVLQYASHREIKQEIRRGLKDKDLVLIEISDNNKSSVNWKENDKEFAFNGEMYDVVSIKKLKNKVQYYCINDHREEKLIAEFKKNHNSEKQTDKKIRTEFNVQFFAQLFVIENYKYATKIRYPNLIFLYKSNNLDIHSPPPKSA
ncbi:MAG: hypothetical protein HXX18_01055 [Bacteroidetes bacterium]|nr:hypothetical protein [Bacteroidota bacterium]